MKTSHAIFDTEIIGTHHPVFLLCVKIVETGETFSFWHHKRGHLKKAITLMERADLTWVSFNGAKFDMPLLAAWVNGHDVYTIKKLASRIIDDRLQPWESYRLVGVEGGLDIDHIDLIEVAPGVMISLKTYAGRMDYPSMVDLPFHHDEDLSPAQCKVLEEYCKNDLGVTEALFHRMKKQLAIRVAMGADCGIDLRSKSDAQIAEAILKQRAGMSKSNGSRPAYVEYRVPALVQTKNDALNDLIDKLEDEHFLIDTGTGAPKLPVWMEEPLTLHDGVYKFGIGGLHSQHDKKVCHTADDEWLISDFDVASYYPSIILLCGLVPELSGGKGEAFLTAYREIYDTRLEAKRTGDKAVADTLKILLNGTFGKLGSKYCAFYSPDLMLAVTITGQLNLLCLIDEISKYGNVISANTDGIVVRYKARVRNKVLATVARNSKQTGFEYDEKQYRKIAFKDVNNYIALTIDGEVKSKGLYAPAGLMKNPTAPVCARAATEYLVNATPPALFIPRQHAVEDFTSIRNVKGGGEQGGIPLGRVARWYMTTQEIEPIRYVSNGNKVPKTDGAKVCLVLPETLPADLDYHWYITETHDMLNTMGVNI